jgi:hypothetical protein
MKTNAELLYREKRSHTGGIVEMVIWRVPEPVPPSEHPFKYRFVFIRKGIRVIGYDNERGKGDHKHINGIEQPYNFINEIKLLEDFWQDVEEAAK